jgi:hypothetical protein
MTRTRTRPPTAGNGVESRTEARHPDRLQACGRPYARLAGAVRHLRFLPSDDRPGFPGFERRSEDRATGYRRGRRPSSNGSRRPTEGEVRPTAAGITPTGVE